MAFIDPKERLTPQQLNFVLEYLACSSAKEAAIKAGYSPRSAEAQASKLLSQSKIQNEITRRQAKIAQKVELTPQLIINEELCLATIDPTIVTKLKNGVPTPPHELPENVRKAISGIDIIHTTSKLGIEKTVYKYRFWDKGKSLERLSRILGIYNDGVQITGKAGDPLTEALKALDGRNRRKPKLEVVPQKTGTTDKI